MGKSLQNSGPLSSHQEQETIRINYSMASDSTSMLILWLGFEHEQIGFQFVLYFILKFPQQMMIANM